MATMSISPENLGDLVTAYVKWHKHSRAVRAAYSAWRRAPSCEEPLRYAAYLEELDREQRACEGYAASVARASV
jgi:hypothetical protein